jgi:hypothetical protein
MNNNVTCEIDYYNDLTQKSMPFYKAQTKLHNCLSKIKCEEECKQNLHDLFLHKNTKLYDDVNNLIKTNDKIRKCAQ